MHSVHENLVIFPGVGAFDHLKWTYDEAFEKFFGQGRGAFEQKIFKNINARGGGGVSWGEGMLKLHFDWYITTCFLRGLFTKTFTMTRQLYTIPKQYRALLELHIELECPGRQNVAQLTIWNKVLCCSTTTSTRCMPIFSKDDRNFFFLTND